MALIGTRVDCYGLDELLRQHGLTESWMCADECKIKFSLSDHCNSKVIVGLHFICTMKSLSRGSTPIDSSKIADMEITRDMHVAHMRILTSGRSPTRAHS
jgi:hypothetical protein